MPQGNNHRFVTQKLPDGVTIVFCEICDGTPGKKLPNGMEVRRTLTSECSGAKLSTEQRLAVGDGELDFRGDQWIKTS